jgi:hypothetical protein
MKKILILFALCSLLFALCSLHAQVTTSTFTGKVSDKDGTMPGATVVALHTPSGTSYGAITNSSGIYTIQGCRVGGPYTVTISHVGFHEQKFEGIHLILNQTFVLNATMTESSKSLEGIEISSTRTLSSQKTGASMNISSNVIATMPSVSRQITDLTRLNPQSNGNGNFAGRDSRYNNFTVDGAAFNNNFGLSSGLPGGGSPISVDAIDALSVNVSSFDIRQSSFTGANINAVTKSGDNAFKGTAYVFLCPGAFNGNHIGENDIWGVKESFKQLYGASVGGPIIKNKLFFFVNAEYEKEDVPNQYQAWNPSTDGIGDASSYTSAVTAADLQTIRDYVKNNYGFDPGEYQNRPNFTTWSYRVLARLDWNINENNKFTIRYNDVQTTKDIETNNNSAPNPRGANRNSVNSIAFTGSNYIMTNTVRSITAELNSIISPKISNKLLASYTYINDKRHSPLDGTAGENFPFIDIYKNGQQYMSLGYELFSKGNNVVNQIVNVTDNMSFYLGKHTITAGLSFDYLYFMNSYLRYATGYYRYASMEDFMNNAAPIAYGLTYGYNGIPAPGADLSFGYAAAYVQDEWAISNNFRLTFGARLELPIYMNKLIDNPSNYKEDQFVNYGNVDLSKWPSVKPLISPRVGFNWDILSDKSLQLRGGTGLFTGMLPFVWFTNQPTNAGVLQNTVELTGANVPAGLGFEANYHDVVNQFPDKFPNQPSDSKPGSLCFIDPNFKLPQIWRSNLAIDYKLPWDMAATFEAVFTKDINVVVQKNINESNPSTKIIDANGNERDAWLVKDASDVWKTSNRQFSNYSYAMMLTNANKGYQYAFTAQLEKKFSYGLEGFIAYTYTVSKDLTTNPGSAANSAWSSNVNINSINNPDLSYSNFSIPHRVLAALTYGYELKKAFGFSVGLYYNGAAQDRYSYTYAKDVNGDGNTSDLMYIPKSADEIKFKDMANATAAEQAEAFMNYVNNDSYLSKHKGEYARRFAAVGPWINRFDAKVLVNLFTNFGTHKRYTLQLSLDCKNIGNMFNSTWGATKSHGLGNYNDIRLLTVAGYENGGDTPTPLYQLNDSSVETFNKNATFNANANLTNAWQLMLGIRFIF